MQHDSDFNKMIIGDNILNVSESSTNFITRILRKMETYCLSNSTFCPKMVSSIKGYFVVGNSCYL